MNGKRIAAQELVYYLLNKPKGVVCTNSDPQGRKKAIDFVDAPGRVFCVGRLDIDTTGAIIITNDSELTDMLTHPRHQLDKTYEVTVKGRITGEAMEKMKKGVWLSEGKTAGAAIKVIRRSHDTSVIQIIIRQGLNRQIRRMFAKTGFRVKRLMRTGIGNITLKGLGVGAYKKLTVSQVKYLKKTASVKGRAKKKIKQKTR